MCKTSHCYTYLGPVSFSHGLPFYCHRITIITPTIISTLDKLTRELSAKNGIACTTINSRHMILPLWQETRASQKNQIRPLVARLAKITVVVQPLPSTEIHEPLPLNMVDCLESNGKGKIVYTSFLTGSSSLLLPSSSLVDNCGGQGGLKPSNIILITVGILTAVLLLALLSTVALFFT